MPCFVCEEPGHTIRTCRHKRSRGAKIFFEIKSTLTIQNITQNPLLLNRGIGIELNKLVVNDLDCLSHFLNVSVSAGRIRKIRLVHTYMFDRFEEIKITDRLRSIFRTYEGTPVIRSYQQMAVDRIDIRRANRDIRVRARQRQQQEDQEQQILLTRHLAIMYQKNQQLIERPEIHVSQPPTEQPNQSDHCPICIETSLILTNTVHLQCGHPVCCQCISKSINLYLRTTYVSCCLCRAQSEKMTVYTEENKNILEAAKRKRKPFVGQEQEDMLFEIVMRNPPPGINTREEFIHYLIHDVVV